ncbi:MAG: hypothetical protein RB292_00685 [Patescibacteria group bacterium]|nr:hypothetical protein [Patescibacteria group bacterium]
MAKERRDREELVAVNSSPWPMDFLSVNIQFPPSFADLKMISEVRGNEPLPVAQFSALEGVVLVKDSRSEVVNRAQELCELREQLRSVANQSQVVLPSGSTCSLAAAKAFAAQKAQFGEDTGPIEQAIAETESGLAQRAEALETQIGEAEQVLRTKFELTPARVRLESFEDGRCGLTLRAKIQDVEADAKRPWLKEPDRNLRIKVQSFDRVGGAVPTEFRVAPLQSEARSIGGKGRMGYLHYLEDERHHRLVIVASTNGELTAEVRLLVYHGDLAGASLVQIQAARKLPVAVVPMRFAPGEAYGDINSLPPQFQARQPKVEGKANERVPKTQAHSQEGGGLTHTPLAEQLAAMQQRTAEVVAQQREVTEAGSDEQPEQASA